MEVGESTIDFVGADAERSCSRRRSVTDATCPLRVLIGLRFATPFPFLLQKRKRCRPPKEKRAAQNRKCKPCRHRVRRSQLHSVSAGAAKTPYPQPSSSFPNCDRFTGAQFGHLEFYNAARYLDDGGQAAFCGYGKKQDFHTPQVQSKALVDGESREPSERFSGRLFLFFAVRHGSFLSPNRERKEWGRKIRFLF